MTQPGTAVSKRDPPPRELADRLLGLAKTPEERAAAFKALDAYRQSKMIREAADAIASLSWGKNISPLHRGQIVRYAYETGTDPVRHWEILGGKLYDTAQLHLDMAASRPDYDGYEHDDLTWNDALSPAEKERRAQERAKYGLPQDTKGACVVRIFRKGIERPFIGANHAGNRKTYLANEKKEGTKLDPIGEQDPGKTAFTRAFRRAAKTAWPIWPYLNQVHALIHAEVAIPPETMERLEGKKRIEAGLQAERELLKKAEALPPISQYPGPDGREYVLSEEAAAEARAREEEARFTEQESGDGAAAP